MKSNRNPFITSKGLRLTAFAAFGIVISAPAAHADVSTWVGNTSADLGGLNWTGTNNPPISGDSWVFGTAGSFGATLNNNLAANLSVAAITFNSTGSAYTISGNAITLTGNITDNFVGTETLNFNIATTAVRTVTTATGSTLVLGGNISGTGGGLIAAGTGTLNLTGANTYTGATQVNSAVNITGTGYINSGSSLSAGSAGTGVLGYSTSGTSTLGSIVLGTGSSNGTLNQSAGTINATSLTMNNALGKRGIYNLSGGTLAVSGTAVVGQRNDTGTAFNLSGSGILTASSLIVGGIGNNNASTYGTFTQSGGTATAGMLTLAQSSSDNTPNVHQGTYNLNGGTLTTGSITGGSPSGTSTHTSTFNFAGGTLIPTAGTTTFMEGLTIANVRNGGAKVDTNGFDITIGQSLLHFAGATSNSLTKTGAGTLTLTGTNTYSAGTSIGGGALTINSGGSITSASGFLSAGSGTGSTASIVNYDSDATSSFSGIALGNAANGTVYQTAGQINVATNILMNTGLGKAGSYNLSGGTLAVAGNVNVGQRGATSVFNLSESAALEVTGTLGVVSNTTLNGTGNTTTGTFTQSGTSTATVGSLLLTNTNNTDQSYNNSATYNLNGGTLATGSIGSSNIGTLAGGANNSTLNLAGGTLKATASTATFMQGLTTANVKDGGVTIDTNGFDITIAQALLHFSGATTDGLTKSGNGTLALSGANTYTGRTDIHSLTVTANSLADSGTSALGFGDLTLGDSGTTAGVALTFQNLAADGTTNRLVTTSSKTTVTINNNDGDNTVAFTNAGNLDTSASSPSSLTFNLGGSNTGNNTFGQIINDRAGDGVTNFTKSGTGTWVLSNAGNSFAGAMTLNTTTTSAGILAYASADGVNPINCNQTTGSATLSYKGASAKTMSGLISAGALSTGAITLDASGVTSADAINYSNTGSLGTAGASGAKNLTLNGTNTGTPMIAASRVITPAAAAGCLGGVIRHVASRERLPRFFRRVHHPRRHQSGVLDNLLVVLTAYLGDRPRGIAKARDDFVN